MITMTTLAEQKIKSLLEEDSEMMGLRIYVKGGGCSGYSYGMVLETSGAVGEDDTVIEHHGIHVIVDSHSAPLLSGAVVDYKDELMGAGFVIHNPHAKTTCGCGSSFSA